MDHCRNEVENFDKEIEEMMESKKKYRKQRRTRSFLSLECLAEDEQNSDQVQTKTEITYETTSNASFVR